MSQDKSAAFGMADYGSHHPGGGVLKVSRNLNPKWVQTNAIRALSLPFLKDKNSAILATDHCPSGLEKDSSLKSSNPYRHQQAD
jgi:hypothetical protein